MEIERHEYRVSYQDYLAGVRFARRRSPALMARFAWSWVWPVSVLTIGIAILWDDHDRGMSWGSDSVILLMLTLLLAATLIWRVSRLRRSYKRSYFAKLDQPICLAFDDEYFVCGLPGRSEGRFFWSALYDFAENERVVLIYTSKLRYLVIPKPAIPQESWSVIRTLVPSRR